MTEATITTVQTDTDTAGPTDEITTLAQGNKVVEIKNRILDYQFQEIEHKTSCIIFHFIDASCDDKINELCEIVDCTKPNAKELCPDHCNEGRIFLLLLKFNSILITYDVFFFIKLLF